MPSYDQKLLARLERAATVTHTPYGRHGARVDAYRLTPRRGAKVRVVVAHATGNDALYPLGPLMEALLAAGCEVFTFDLDGHGRTSTTTLSADGTEATTAIADAMDVATRRQPSLPTHLLGQSLGGALALAAAAAADIRSLTIIGTPLILSLSMAAAVSELGSGLRRAHWRLGRFYGVMGLLPALGPWRRAAYPVRLAPGREPHPPYPTAVARLLATLALRERATHLKLPTLCVYGSRDRIAPPRHGQILAGAIAGARLAVIRGATHFTLPLEPEALRVIADFIVQGKTDAGSTPTG